MAVLRSGNFLSQQRVDVPHLRLIESAVAGDFDLAFGKMMAGQTAVILKGFNILMANAVGAAATALQVNVADGQVIHFGASVSGSIFCSATGATTEQLSSTNQNASGSFTANATNYIGLDLTRSLDIGTADAVAFLNATTQQEISQTVPLARTLQYRLVISPNAFSATSNVCPIAKVVTDAANNVVSVTDARNLLWRLGTGGDSPDVANKFTWSSRKENAGTSTSTTDPFTGGDKGIASLRDFVEASETRLWELGGGEYWYSATADRNVKLTRNTTYPPGANDNFAWSGTDLTWAGLKIAWDNSTGYYNVVADQNIASAGLTDLAIGDCLYVDIVRATNAATVTAVKGTLTTLGAPVTPGSRFVLAWRTADGIYAKDQAYTVGTPIPPATTTALGAVKLLTNAVDPTAPVVPVTDSNKSVVATGLSRNSTGGGSITSGTITVATGANDSALTVGRDGINVTSNGKLLLGTQTLGGGGIIDCASAVGMQIGLTNAIAITMGSSAVSAAAPSLVFAGQLQLVANSGTDGSGVTPGNIGGAHTITAGTGGAAGAVGAAGQGGDVTIKGGDSGAIGAGGAASQAGKVVIDGGAGPGTGGLVNIATANASAVTIGRSGIVTTVASSSIHLTGSNPASTSGFSNSITPKNICKSWGTLTTGASPTVQDGFNIASPPGAGAANMIRVTFATAMSTANYAVPISVDSNQALVVFTSKSPGSFDIGAYNPATSSVVNLQSTSVGISFAVFGAQ